MSFILSWLEKKMLIWSCIKYKVYGWSHDDLKWLEKKEIQAPATIKEDTKQEIYATIKFRLSIVVQKQERQFDHL